MRDVAAEAADMAKVLAAFPPEAEWLAAAARAAPYVHPKLSQVSHRYTDEHGKSVGPTIIYTGLEPPASAPPSPEAGDREDDKRH